VSFLAVRDCTKTYAGVPALKSVCLSVAAGEIHALMGENGAGKSTLIRILAGVEQADQVAVTVAGQAVTIDGPNAAFDHGLRFIHQELNVVPTLSVAENIFLSRPYPRRLGALVNWSALAAVAGQALRRLGISHIDPRRKIGELGHGDQMLVRISAALLEGGGPAARLYVMDEPTASLTGEESERLFSALHAIRRSGRSVLYVSHRLDEVVRLCDRVTVLRGGKLISTRAIGDTTRSQIVRDMIGRPVEEVYPRAHKLPEPAVALDVNELTGVGLGPLSFRVRKGEVVGLAGLSGAGQKEVLRLLMGADRRASGTVLAGGRKYQPRSPAAAWKRGLAFVPGERRSLGLILSRAIADNMSLPHLRRFTHGGAFLARRRERDFARAAGEEVRLVALGPRQLARELSGGNQQKVVFARALAGNPDILLLDEPTRGVDVGAKFDIYGLIRAIAARGTGVLIASSDFPELIGMCDSILVMRDRSISTVLDTDGLSEETLLNHCYGYGDPADVATSGTVVEA
jgi:ABC-type sugar transport system ATPase subunit